MEKENIRSSLIVFILAGIQLLTVSCDSADSFIKRGDAHLALGDFLRAEQCFSAAIDAKPELRQARMGLGKALLQRHAVYRSDTTLIAQALVQLEAARALKPDSSVEMLLAIAWFSRAEELLAASDTLGALGALSRSISLDQTSIRPLNLAGVLYFHRHDSNKALSLFRLVVAKDSLSATGYFNTGMVYWADGEYSSAYKNWFRAAQCAPDDREIVLWAAKAKAAMSGGGNK